MVLEEQPQFLEWLLRSLVITFPIMVALVTVVGLLIGFIISATRRGPVEGFYAVANVVASGVADLRNLSLRRTFAMTILAFQESLRRRVLIVFAVFVVVMLLAGWYLDVKSDQPARLYLSFVMTTSNYLVLLLGLFLSTFSLPNDFKNRTIHTVVTKPVRPLEIILGRILGFTGMGTLLLAGMCVVSYLFVYRGLNHTHEVVDVQPSGTSTSAPSSVQGRTQESAHHSHTFELGSDGTGETDLIMGHRHEVRRTGDGADAKVTVGRPLGLLQARVPKRGKLKFLDRAGNPSEKGINVGEEWMYRSYIEGGTLAEAYWTFDRMTADRYPEGFTLELDIRVFRTHKGDIEKGVRGSIFLKSSDPGAKIKRSEEFPFRAKEFAVDRHFIPRMLKGTDANGVVHDVDIFKDLAQNGELRVSVQCSDSGQYFGMAMADVYILDANAPFWLNFIKGFAGVWLQMVLVTTFGVMFSTFLSGPVAMMATLSSIVVGMFTQFIVEVARGIIQGGGPIESLIRMVTQMNVQSDMEIGGVATAVVRGVDFVFMQIMQVAANVLPNYETFNTAAYVAYGYNIEAGLLAMHVIRGLAYLVMVSIVGYFFLKTREVAA